MGWLISLILLVVFVNTTDVSVLLAAGLFAIAGSVSSLRKSEDTIDRQQ